MSRQRHSIRDFNPSNEPGTCLYCGEKLKPEWGTDGRGVRGEGFFCSIVDALEFATIAATKGMRYTRKKEDRGR